MCCASPAVNKAWERLADAAVVIDAGEPLSLHTTLADVAASGVRRVMVDCGGSGHTQFLTSGQADELFLVVAPFFVGDVRTPRFVGAGSFRGTQASA